MESSSKLCSFFKEKKKPLWHSFIFYETEGGFSDKKNYFLKKRGKTFMPVLVSCGQYITKISKTECMTNA